jgi:hypothetical protein
MRIPALTAAMLLAATFGSGQTVRRSVSQENGPQRTMETAPPESSPGTAAAMAGGDDAYVRSAVETYRRSWEGMSARTRKMLLSHGGQTPDQYERNLRQRLAVNGQHTGTASASPTATAPNGGMSTAESGRQLNLDVLNTMKTSAGDLNAIRDGNLQRVQKGGCAPEVALRLAELKGRLAAQENELRGPAGAGEPPKGAAGRSGSAAPLPGEWFKSSAEQQPRTGEPRDAANQQLDAVLGTNTRETGPAEPAAAKPADAERRKQAEAEIALTRAELDGLAGACAPQHSDLKEKK